jgi:hypothetical protein
MGEIPAAGKRETHKWADKTGVTFTPHLMKTVSKYLFRTYKQRTDKQEVVTTPFTFPSYKKTKRLKLSF